MALEPICELVSISYRVELGTSRMCGGHQTFKMYPDMAYESMSVERIDAVELASVFAEFSKRLLADSAQLSEGGT